jgi:hypothetical protein
MSSLSGQPTDRGFGSEGSHRRARGRDTAPTTRQVPRCDRARSHPLRARAAASGRGEKPPVHRPETRVPRQRGLSSVA